MFLEQCNVSWSLRCEPSSGRTLPTTAVGSVRELRCHLSTCALVTRTAVYLNSACRRNLVQANNFVQRETRVA